MNDSGADDANDIIIVDDDLLTLEFFKRSLRNTDLKLRCFSDALRALEYLQNHTPRVLLIDHRMPRLDGLELLQTLADEGAVPATRAYLCSGVALSEDVCSKALKLDARPLLKDVLRSKNDFLELLAEP